MQSLAILAAGLVFLAVGIALGLLARRGGAEAARAAGRQEAENELVALREQLRARDEQVAEARRLAEGARAQGDAAQARIVALSGEVAAVRTEAAAVPELRKALAAAQAEAAQVREERARVASVLEAERRATAERLAEAERNREQVRAEVEKLAGRVLDEKGGLLLARNEKDLKALLEPLGEKLKAFESKVDRTYDQENRDRARLLESLKTLQEAQRHLHDEAAALSRALTGESKAQGDWGELVLEKVLEAAGLTEGREYDLQKNHVDDEGGRKRPDALVYLPGNRVVVVDAKCSLTAFVEAARAATPEAREAALDAHVASVRTHVRQLAAKSYQDVVDGRTIDIVLLFVPNEAAFTAAISRAAGLYEEAFRQRIVLCSPTTLLAALQLVSHVWRTERQNENAQEIAEEAGRMLEKLAGFVKDLDGVGERLDQAQASFAAARGKLATGKGNVMKKARDIVALGARVKTDRVDALLLEAGDDEDAADGGGARALPAAAAEPGGVEDALARK